MVRKKVKPVAKDEILPTGRSSNSVAGGDNIEKKDENAMDFIGGRTKKGKDVVDDKAKEKKLAGKKKRNKGIRKGDKSVGKKDFVVVENLEKGGNVLGKKRKRGADGEIMEAFLRLSSGVEGSALGLRPRKQVPSFRMVTLGESDFKRIVGKRVKVFWPDSRRWFFGRVASFDSEKMVHVIFYDDGDKEELNLMGERFELEVMPNEVFSGSDVELKMRPKKKDMGSHIADGEGTVKKNSLGEEVDAQLEKKGLKTRNRKIKSKAAKKGSPMQQDKKDHAQKEVEKTACVDRQADVLPAKNKENVIRKECDNAEKPGEANSEENHGKTEPKALNWIHEMSNDAKDAIHEVEYQNEQPENLTGKKEKSEKSEYEGDETKTNGLVGKNTSEESKTDRTDLQPLVDNVDNEIKMREGSEGLASLDKVLNGGSNVKTADLQLKPDGETMKDEGQAKKVREKHAVQKGRMRCKTKK